MIRLVIGDHLPLSRVSQTIKQIVWDSSKLINHHLLICGKSGSGKSYLLLKMIGALAHQKIRVHVIDSHEDLSICDEDLEFKAVFSTRTMYGFNPLEVNTNEHSGGVRITINNFIVLIEAIERKLQVRQKNILRSLLEELYENRGIVDDDPSTWRKRRLSSSLRSELIASGRRRELINYYPVLDDLIDLGYAKFNSIYGVGDWDSPDAMRAATAIKNLRETFKALSKLRAAADAKDQASLSGEQRKIDQDQEKFRSDAKDSFSSFVDNMVSGREMSDLINYEGRESFSSILIRLKDLKSSGIFSGNIPPFDTSKTVWNYNIANLPAPERKALVYYLMSKIFEKRISLGHQSDVVEIIVVDEAHRYFSPDSENIFNVIAKEARKYGLGLWCASQSASHFSDDFVSTVATKCLLRTDNVKWPQIEKSWGISQSVLSAIISKKTCAIYMDASDSSDHTFKIASVEGKPRLQAVS